jgi:endonuclease YncB( thermonuclease family)
MKQILLMIAVVGLNLPAFAASTFIGKVTKVTDGDTINVLTTDNKLHKIRLEGIDAPESGQPLGDKSKQALTAKVLNKQVTVTWSKLDVYQRLLVHITVGGGGFTGRGVVGGDGCGGVAAVK